MTLRPLDLISRKAQPGPAMKQLVKSPFKPIRTTTQWAVFVMMAFCLTLNSSLPAFASAWTEGAKTLLFMRVDFSDMPGEPITVAAAQTLVGTDANNFYIQNSYNKTSIAVTVTPTVLRMPQTAAFYGSDNAGLLLDDARTAAKAAGYDTVNYNLDIVAFNTIAGFNWAGLGYVGGKGVWLNGYFGLREVGHEVGHNYGLWHANLWNSTDSTPIGPGSSTEYGDPYDMMGSGAGTSAHHFNSWFKSSLDWITPAGVQTVTSSGTYRIQQHDSVSSNGLRALKINKDATKNYWVEFRQAFTSNPWVMNGAVIHWDYSPHQGSDLLDMTPGSTDGSSDSALLIGRTFADTAANLYVTPIGKGGTSPETLDVVVNIGPFPGNQAPTLSISPTSATVNSGTPVNFVATASDSDGDTLSYCWDFGDKTFASTASTSKTWNTGGMFTVLCTVTDRKGGTASATATITVVPSYIVTNTSDSGTGSLRAALTFASSNPGANISFNIPTSDSGYQSGVFVIQPASALPAINANGTIIDGATQTSFTGNTNAAGPEIMIKGLAAGANVNGFSVYKANCVVKNLIISGFTSAGIQMAGSSANNNTIQGCFIGTDATGTSAVANSGDGIILYASANHNTIGGTTAGAGNVISGNGGTGIHFQQAGTSYNLIQGNRIGTNAAGTASVKNNSSGVFIWLGAQNNTIGGSASARNIISGNGYNGIAFDGNSTPSTSGNVVQSNYIGVDATGANALPNYQGVAINGNATGNTIGGATAVLGNLIASNGAEGIYVGGTGTGNSIRANSISGNGSRGINLQAGSDSGATYYVTPNDAGDADTGPNNLQNFPVITAANVGGSLGTINFSLNSAANRAYTLDFFRSATADNSGYGEGAVYVGSKDVTTDGSGNVSSSLSITGSGGAFFTATATDNTTGDTSEFSQAVQMTVIPPSLQFSASNFSVTENGATATISVTRVGSDSGAVSVSYATADGTATASDYTATTGTLNWANGDLAAKSFTVAITNDSLVEGNETVNLSLTNPTGGAVLGSPATATLTITDDDVTVSVQFGAAAYSAAETGGNATITVTRNTTAGATSVDYATSNGTASAGSDYSAATGTISFSNGENSKSFTVPVLDDSVWEGDETVNLTLSNPTGGAVLGSPATATLTVNDSEVQPQLSINDVTTVEGNSGTTIATFTVTLSGASAQTVSVNYATADGTATQPSDYTAVANTPLTFAPGDLTKTVTVAINGDTAIEPDEAFSVNLSGEVNATLLDGAGSGTITDDDTPPSIAITDTTVTEGDSGTTPATFTVSLSKPSIKTVTVAYGAVKGTTNPATVSTDFLSTKGTVTFSPGQTSKTVTVPVVGDYVPEVNETFLVSLSSPVNATFSDSQGLGTITNDDFDTTPPTVSFTTSTTTPVGTTPASSGTIYNTIPAITGVAADAGSGIAKVTLRLYRATATAGVFEYWNGTSWITPGGTVMIPTLNTVLSAAAGSANVSWNKSGGWPTGSNLADGTYYLSVSAYDRAGQMASSSRNFKKLTDAVLPTVSFTTSTTTPVGTTPAAGGTISGAMPAITGVAADSFSGVARVDLRLYRPTATAGVFEYWNGTSWITPGGAVAIPTLAATLNPATGGANVGWSKSSGWPTGTAFADGTYYLSATAYDRGANTATSSRNFKKVTTAPAPIPASVSGAASVSASSITLNFTGAVPAGDFAVAVNDAATPVQSVERNGQTVTLLLLDGAMQTGDQVSVTWNGGIITTTAE